MPNVCAYCDRPIVEGQHYIRLCLYLDTDMTAFHVDPSLIDAACFCTIHCARQANFAFINEALKDERVQDTFHPIHG